MNETDGKTRYDVWLVEAPSAGDPVVAIARVFGVELERARRIVESVPRPVRRSVSLVDAEETAGALRVLGAKVELRPSRVDAKGSGPELVRPIRRRAEMGTAEAASRDAATPLRLDLDGPLVGGKDEAPKKSRDQRQAPVSATASEAPAARLGASEFDRAGGHLDPLDPLAEGSGALELAFEPEKKPSERAAELAASAGRRGIDLEALRHLEAQRLGEQNEAPRPRRFEWPTFPPWAPRTAAIATLAVVVTWGLRAVGRYLVQSPAHEVIVETPSPDERTLESAVEVSEFLLRPGARLGVRDADNRAFVRTLRARGAIRVLAGDVVDVGDALVATRLVVELPNAPARRRPVAAATEGYRSGRLVEPEMVALPEGRFLFVELDPELR